MTRENLTRLIGLYEKEYDKLYASNSTGTDQDLIAFDALLLTCPETLRGFNNARNDILSSDRECAAFARAFRILVYGA